ncbi:MAG: biopolymer transporter ExbD [Bacteroidota bacterium]
MLKKQRRKNDNSINAGSMADIAFLLLIFFLVTTTITEDQGLLVKLPRWEDTPVEPKPLNKRNVFNVLVNSDDELQVEGELAKVSDLRAAAKLFISNPTQSKLMPEIPAKAIISLQNDRSTSYETYLAVYNELKAAYVELRNEEALRNFGKAFEELEKDKQKSIRAKIPLVISEAEPTDLLVSN